MGKKKQKTTADEDLKEKGNKAFLNGKYLEAIDFYSQALAIQKKDVYFSNRANAYLELDKNDECISDCKSALKLDSKNIKAIFRLARALTNLSKVEEAMA